MKNKKFKYEAPISMFIKKHYCPKCSNILTIKKIKKIVNSTSDEAKNFDFSTDDGVFEGLLVGDVEFIWYVYHCINCDIEISNKDMRKYERERKGIKEKIRSKKENAFGLILFIIISIILLLIFSNI